MSTRTSIKVKYNGETIANLYRHYDGYPSETGANLIETARQYTDAAAFVRALMSQNYDPTEYDKSPRPIYRIEATPDDIEHYYVMLFEYDKEIRVYHAHDTSRSANTDWLTKGSSYALDEFTVFVNSEREKDNARILALYPDREHELYPMLAVAQRELEPTQPCEPEPKPEPAKQEAPYTGPVIELRDEKMTGWGSDVFNADICPKHSIRLFGSYKNHTNGPVSYDITFKIGDYAEYDSYNLSYTGEIVAIGPKTVTIRHYQNHDYDQRKSRLPVGDFAWRNWDYDAERIASENANTMQYI